jgi:hypothetical protein
MTWNNKILSKYYGLIGSICAILFFTIFYVLGLVQPNYNHVSNTVSELVLGKWGWIQNVNFVIFTFSGIFIYLGLRKIVVVNQLIKVSIVLSIIGLIMLLVFTTGKFFHYFFAYILIVTVSLMAFGIVKGIKDNHEFDRIKKYSYGVLILNLVGGNFVFWLMGQGLCLGWIGLFQKILIVNVVAWLTVLGWKIYKYN